MLKFNGINNSIRTIKFERYQTSLKFFLCISGRLFSSTSIQYKDGLESVNFLEKETFRDIKRQKSINKARYKSNRSDRVGTDLKLSKKSSSYIRQDKSRPIKAYNRSNHRSKVEEYIQKSPENWKAKRDFSSSNSDSTTTNISATKSIATKPHPANFPFPRFNSYDAPYFRSFELDSSKLSYSPLEVPDQPPVPKLAHNLDRVLFSPGVHVLKDTRSNVYNFSPYLENIMSIKDFDFDFIAKYVPSGKDSTLANLAKQNDKKYTGSTSSLTSVLTQFHHLLSHKRKPHTMSLSKYFRTPQVPFSVIQTQPVSIFLRYNHKTDTLSIDSDKSRSDDIIVSILGHQLEAMLTTPEVEFEKYRKSLSHNLHPSLKGGLNTYNYTQSGDFLMRSQLDCYDERLPGTGMFDLKTRAVCAVRHDMDYTQIHDGSSYQINKLDGEFESFSREWFELIRSTMFKYSLQARIGRMDGIFLAYHNIRKMFGFQYVPLSEIDQIFHTSNLINDEKFNMKDIEPTKLTSFVPLDDQMAVSGPIIAENEFKLSLKLFNEILDKIIVSHDEPAASFNIVFHAVSSCRMHIFVKPMLEKDIEIIQETGFDKEEVDSKESKNYSINSDPHTIMMHANKDPEFLPPDVKLYQLDIRTYINGEFVPGDKHPHLSTESDVWTVQCELSQLRRTSAERRYSRTFANSLAENRITSTPQTERLDELEEETIRNEALSKLAPPNPKQEYLRFLSIKGENLEREWDNEHGHKEKQIWTPKLVERVQ